MNRVFSMRHKVMQSVLLSQTLIIGAWGAAHASPLSKEKRLMIRHALASHNVSGLGSFTPASADPRLAAVLARTGMMNTGFRFTPANSTAHMKHGVTVAIRARSSLAVQNLGATTRILPVGNSTALNLAPTSYNLGVALGWKKFALTGDYNKSDLGLLQGGRESANLGLSYNQRRWSSRISVGSDRALANALPALGMTDAVTLDVGGSYRISRNFDLSAGVRYKREQDRLDQIIDNKRDGQAVYVGTQFRF